MLSPDMLVTDGKGKGGKGKDSKGNKAPFFFMVVQQVFFVSRMLMSDMAGLPNGRLVVTSGSWSLVDCLES